VGAALLAAYVLSNLFGPAAERSMSATMLHVLALAVLIATATIWRPRAVGSPSHAEGEALLPTVRRLASVIDAADPFTRGRAYRVSRYAVRIAEELGVDARTTHEIELAGLLHNIGRVAIHRDVLLKSGRLTDAERREIETHPDVAYAILGDIPALAPAAELVRAHHERPDGRGYPRGLGGKEIPLGSQIVMVASAFDAMTSDRPYRPGLSAERALEELRAGAGSQFSKKAVDCLVALYESRSLFDRIDREELGLYGDEAGVLAALDQLERRDAPTASEAATRLDAA
jgi:HD-GYP domain-containing protein (c-di-GMP phosphodiesterase class II)